MAKSFILSFFQIVLTLADQENPTRGKKVQIFINILDWAIYLTIVPSSLYQRILFEKQKNL